jgi:hypothetical protein
MWTQEEGGLARNGRILASFRALITRRVFVNIWRVTLEMRAVKNVALYFEFSLFYEILTLEA